MQSTDINQINTARRRVQSSTTLNRKYLVKPVAKKAVGSDSGTIRNSTNNVVRVRMQARATASAPVKKVTAAELKERAIRKALAEANRISESETGAPKVSNIITTNSERKEGSKSPKLKMKKLSFSTGRIFLALGCATIAVLAIVYFVSVNMPDISLKVAAMQTGIEKPYPSYVPRDYGITDASSEDGRIIMGFKNSHTGGEFTIVEEKSSWDSNALLSNYVKDTYGENYDVVREQGLTIYISGSDAAWVNGGIVHKIKTVSGTLTKKQICAIATSF